MHQITPLHLQSLIDRWKQRLRPATAYNYGRRLVRLLNSFAAASGQPDLPRQVPRLRPGKPRRTIASPQDIAALVTAAPPWLRVIVLLAANAGLRRSDCLRVAPIHYNAETGVITIDQQKTGDTVSIPVTEGLANLLNHAPAGSPSTPFYQLYRGKPISADGLTTAWHTLKKNAGADPHLWLHDLRRTLAVSLYEISKDLRVVEQMLGHANLSSTVRYIEHRDPAKLRPYLNALFIPKGPVQ